MEIISQKSPELWIWHLPWKCHGLQSDLFLQESRIPSGAAALPAFITFFHPVLFRRAWTFGVRFFLFLHAVCNLLTGVPVGPQTLNPGRSRPNHPDNFLQSWNVRTQTHLVQTFSVKQKLYFLVSHSYKGGGAASPWTRLDVGRPASLQVVVVEEILKVCGAEESRGKLPLSAADVDSLRLTEFKLPTELARCSAAFEKRHPRALP